MFFDSLDSVPEIAVRTGTSIFVVPDIEQIAISGALVLQPENKATITIEQIREMLAGFSTRQDRDRFVIIRPADKLGIEAANAFLKNLEEPKDKVHFILVTSQPSRLLPTILSRAHIYILKTKYNIAQIKADDEKKKTLAKALISARPSELVSLAQQIASKKDKVRVYTLEILETAIEMLYKSYFLTRKEIFLKKLPKFFCAYENILKNGNIKLHLVADLC